MDFREFARRHDHQREHSVQLYRFQQLKMGMGWSEEGLRKWVSDIEKIPAKNSFERTARLNSTNKIGNSVLMSACATYLEAEDDRIDIASEDDQQQNQKDAEA